MYGLTTKFDLRAFEGRQLEAVTFAENAIHMAFTGGVALTSLTWVEYRLTPEGASRIDSLPVRTSGLMTLVGGRVSHAERTATGGLQLSFDRGAIVCVDDDSPTYECYSVTAPDGEFFV